MGGDGGGVMVVGHGGGVGDKGYHYQEEITVLPNSTGNQCTLKGGGVRVMLVIYRVYTQWGVGWSVVWWGL